MAFVVVILLLIVLLLFANYPVQMSIVLGVLVFIGIVVLRNSDKKFKEILRQERESKEHILNSYNEIKSKITIPDNVLKVNYKSGYAKLLNTKNYIWIDNKDLCFFPANPPEDDIPINLEKVNLYKIPITKIEYYATRGEIVHENKITGGGGGGSSISGAVVGGVLAGGAGAVIGSRKKTDPIKSELITHDTRETFLNFFDETNVKHSMFFNFSDYKIFNELMPEKAFEIVNAIKTNNILNTAINQNKVTDITEQIRELAKLKEEGILTEEEFSEKKKSLLEKIS